MEIMRRSKKGKDVIKNKDVYKAVNENNIKKVKTILMKRRHLVNLRHDDETLLHIACEKGYSELVKILLSMGADISAKNDNGWTPLHNACMYSQLETVQLLLENEADANAKCVMGNTPLHHGARTGNVKVLIALMHREIDVNTQNIDGWSALHRAVCSRQIEAVNFLLAEGIDPHLETATGKTAYDISLSMMYYEISKILHKYEIPPPTSYDEQQINDDGCFTRLLNKSKETVTSIIPNDVECSTFKSLLPNTSPREITDDFFQKTCERSFKTIKFIKQQHSKNTQFLRANSDPSPSSVSETPFENRDTTSTTKNHDSDDSDITDDENDECPVCFEIPLPPKRIYQCHNGHIYCSECKKQPNMTKCPQCGDLIIGLENRNRYAEETIIKLYNQRSNTAT